MGGGPSLSSLSSLQTRGSGTHGSSGDWGGDARGLGSIGSGGMSEGDSYTSLPSALSPAEIFEQLSALQARHQTSADDGRGGADGSDADGAWATALSDDSMRALAPALAGAMFSAGEVLFTAGEPTMCVGLIASGASAETRDAELLVRSSGDFVGEESLLSQGVRPADVVAIEDGVLLMLAYADFDELRRRAPTLQAALLRALVASAAEQGGVSPPTAEDALNLAVRAAATPPEHFIRSMRGKAMTRAHIALGDGGGDSGRARLSSGGGGEAAAAATRRPSNVLPSHVTGTPAMRMLHQYERSSPWLSDQLPLTEAAMLARALAFVRLTAGQPVMRAGETASFVALALDCTLEVSGPGLATRRVPPGAVIGYAGLFQRGESSAFMPREANVTAASEGHVALISYNELALLATTAHAGAARMLQLLARCMYTHILEGKLHGLGELSSELLSPMRATMSDKKLAPIMDELESRDWPSQGKMLSEAHAETLYRRLKYKRGFELADVRDVLPQSFVARIMRPDGTSRLQPFPQDMSIAQAVRMLADKVRMHALGADAASQFVLQVPGTGAVLASTDATLAGTYYVRSYLQYRRLPLLRLATAADAERYALEVEAESDEAAAAVHALLGHPLSWSSESEEVIDFRRSMLALRPTSAAEYEAAKVHRQLPTYKDATPPLATLPSTFKVKIYFQGHDMSKTLMGTRNQKVSDLRDLAYSKMVGEAPYPPKQMVLKFVALNEYLDDGELIDYVTVRQNLKRDKTIRLHLCPHPHANSPPLAPPAPPPVHRGRTGSATRAAAAAAKPSEFPSVWALSPHVKMRIRIVSLEATRAAKTQLLEMMKGSKKAATAAAAGGSGIHWLASVSVGLFNGGSPLCTGVESAPIVCDEASNALWNQWLATDLSVCHAPQAARACFTVHGRPLGSKRSAPIGWVSLPLFDHKDELVSGLYALRLWPGAEANPIGPSMDNVSVYGPETPVLYVQFERHCVPLVLPANVEGRPPNANGMMPPSDTIKELKQIIERDPLTVLTRADKDKLWMYKHFIMTVAAALPKFLQCVSWADHNQVKEMHALLHRWAPLKPVAALELLDAKFADAQIRSYAVGCLEDMSDGELAAYVLQLVQVLKYESRHDSALARFLLRRALRCPHNVGHTFFWCLKAEMHVAEVSERFGLLLQEYLRCCGAHREQLALQCKVETMLKESAEFVKRIKKSERIPRLREELSKIVFPERFPLPLDARFECSGLRVEKCKCMDSKKVPLWLVFTNADPIGDDLYIIFKCGDDLRQDQLTLQIIKLMERRWERAGLDLRLSPYLCVSTGDEVGFLEVVLNSRTTADITKTYARGATAATAAFAKEPMDLYLREHNPTVSEYEKAVETFLFSLAGYCVATYVMGIGDRHNDNIMLSKLGHLFHIDFGHFLGNFKKKFGFKREIAPFVFTPDFAYVLGDKGAENFEKFVKLCGSAYNVIRTDANEFINLFQLMLSTGIPELRTAEDIDWLRECMLLGESDESAARHFTNKIDSALATVRTQINNAIHILAH